MEDDFVTPSRLFLYVVHPAPVPTQSGGIKYIPLIARQYLQVQIYFFTQINYRDCWLSLPIAIGTGEVLRL